MLKQLIEKDLKDSMLSRDELKRSVLRMLISSIRNKEIELQKKDSGLLDEEVQAVITSEVKRRKDSIAEFEKGGRKDLVDSENDELQILASYLPPELSDDEIKEIVVAGIKESNATSQKDFGNAMRAIMPLVKGKASGERVSAILKDQLSLIHND